VTQETGRDKSDETDLVDVAEEAARSSARESANQSGKAAKKQAGTKTGGKRGSLLRSLPTVVIVLLIVLLFPAFIARAFVIPSGSMETTLHGCTGCDNDRVLVDRLTTRFTEPRQGQVLVFLQPWSWHNSELHDTVAASSGLSRVIEAIGSAVGIQPAGRTDLIKRVIAVGGQTVGCCDARNRVTVDGKPLDEPYVYFAPEFGPAMQAPFGPIVVPKGELWMMGDSRNNSVDSRAQGNGPVPVADVLGRARLIIYPFSRFGLIGGAPTPAEH
jgi:signal peptidase I